MQVLSALLIGLGLINTYFALRAVILYQRDPHHSPLLLSLATADVAVWLMGIYIAALAALYISRPQPVTLGGLTFGLMLLLIEVLPGFIYVQMRRIERGS